MPLELKLFFLVTGAVVYYCAITVILMCVLWCLPFRWDDGCDDQEREAA